MNSPFKFLDAYTREDREVFFGREREIEELYQKVFEGRILLLYGVSGTGKTSLINCGLANKFEESDWLPIHVRRGKNINNSLNEEIRKEAVLPLKEGVSVQEAIQSIYLDHFKPLYLIFDQFEELFIFGDRDEREEFARTISGIINSEVQCRCLFSIREEYLAGVTEFESVIPDFLANRMRVEKMTHQKAREVIEGPCRVNGISVEGGFADALLQKLTPENKEIELTYLQVFLDRIFKISGTTREFTLAQIQEAGNVSDLLGRFLEEQIGELDDPETGLVVLKAFVSMQGTKKLIGEGEIADFAQTLGSPLDRTRLTDLLQRFVSLRVLKDKDEHNQYELRHDSLAVKIYEKITLMEKELLEVKDFLDGAYSNYKRREVLLNEPDLKYIAPYEGKLFLNRQLQQFLDDSKKEIARAQRRKRRLVVAAAGILIIILAFFTVWAMQEQRKAVEQQKIAEEQRAEAVKAMDQALAAQKAANLSRNEAERSSEEALSQKRLADSALLVAEYQRNRSEEQRKRAETLFEEANQQRQIALAAQEDAEKAASEVRESNRKAMFQLYLFNAQEFASKSLLIEKNDTLAALLAKTAFNLVDHGHRYYGDSKTTAIYDVRLYEAAQKALIRLGNDTLYSLVHWAIDMDGGLVAISDKRDQVVISELTETDPGGFPGLTVKSSRNLNEQLRDPLGRKISALADNAFLKLLVLDRENQRFICGNSTGQVTVTHLAEEGTTLLYSHRGRISSIIESPRYHIIVSAGTDGILIIYNLEKEHISFEGEFGFSPGDLSLISGRYLIMHDEKGTFYSLDILEESPVPVTIHRLNRQVEAFELSETLNWAAIAGSGLLTFIQLDESGTRVLKKKEFPVPHTGMISDISFSPDGRWLALSGYDGIISLWNLSTYDLFEQENLDPIIHFPGIRIRRVLFTGNSRYLIYSDFRSAHIYPVNMENTLKKLIYKLGDKQLSEDEWSTYVKGEIDRPE